MEGNYTTNSALSIFLSLYVRSQNRSFATNKKALTLANPVCDVCARANPLPKSRASSFAGKMKRDKDVLQANQKAKTYEPSHELRI
jgi:hypothetical protein